MSASVQISLPLDVRPYNNQRLFADHYLDDPQRLRALADWQQAEGADEAFRTIDRLYTQRAVHFDAQTNEAQTEHDFIQPVLDLLWGPSCYQVQVRIPNVDVQQQPDYAFFRTAEARQAAQSRHGTLDYWREIPCLGDAKRWTASLDKERGLTENPSNQISNYLYRSGARWGILTNGRLWRLYEREKSRAGGIYYEVDLERLLQNGNLEAFKYFYLFFRRDAFLPDSSGATFMEKVFQGSVDYATEVGDKLKESVYDALRHLMNGFFAYPGNGLDAHDPDTVRQVHEHCLIVLYRLLFILYAEDCNLLPRDDEPYASYSLAHLHRQINQQLRAQHAYVPHMTGLWHHVLNLFQLIDTGFSEGGIPAYNGGLFSPAHYPHIAHTPQPNVTQWQIDDRHCAEVINLLAYERDRWDEAGTRDVDYATLAVQHLGSVYEGLLELQPRIAEEAMVETTEDGKPVFKPAREVPNPRPIRGQPPRRINAGEVYLVTNRGERKATGSYYTPKYIVDYIVEQTIGALADEAAKKVVALRPEVEREVQQLERQRQEGARVAKKKSSPGGSLHDPKKQVAKLDTLIENQKRRLLEPYLSLNILDPAMGSGHFLVGAADHLSLAMATDPNILPFESMEDEEPQLFYKRLVVERCLYGVDLNPLAVELAKLSLWLHTISKDKALSFLDHHLRCGNSLIGARVEDDLMKEPPRFNARGKRLNADKPQLVFGFTSALTAIHLQHFLDAFRQIVEMPSGDAETERKKDRLYRDMDTARDRYRAVANCWLAPFFGAPVTPEQYERAVNILRSTADADWRALTQEVWFAHAQQVAREKRFFHWELEFPEIFFHPHGLKPKEEHGFDVVIGNPPYVSVTNIDSNLRDYLLARFDTAIGRFDLYITFVERALSLLREHGMFGFIQPIKFAIFANGKPLRDLLLGRTQIERIVDVSQCRVFPDPTTYPCLPIVKKCLPPSGHKLIAVQAPPNTPESINRSNGETITVVEIPQSRFLETPEHVICLRLSDGLWNFIKRVGESSFMLGDMFDIEQCIRIGSEAKRRKLVLEESRYLSAPTQVKTSCRKMLDGENIERYAIIWDGYWLHYLSDELYNPKSPDVLETQKILIKRIASSLTAVPDLGLNGDYFYPLNTIYALIVKGEFNCSLYYVAALLNSTFLDWHYKLLFEAIAIRGGYIEYREYLKYLPIRRIAFTTPSDERARLVEEGKKLYYQMIEGMGKQR